MNKFISSTLTQSLFLITLFSLIAYTPLIPFLGFYSDDFFFAYIAHFFGFEGIMKSLIVDRPFNGYLLAFNYFLLGDNVFLWHLYAYFFKLAGGFILFFTLFKLWPKSLQVNTLITLLFLLYPGYLQQTLPLGFVNWTITLNLWMLSLLFTVLALKTNTRFKFFLFTTISLIFQINSFLQLEFFIGMETFRALIINHLTNRQFSFKNAKKTFIYLLPYVACLVGFIIWRIFTFKASREVTDITWIAQNYYSNSFWILTLPLELLHSFGQSLVGAFFIPASINILRLPLADLFISILIGFIACFILYLYLRNYRFIAVNRFFGKEIFIIGALSLLGSLIPIIISGRTVRMFNVLDRYTLTGIISISLILVGLMLYKIPPRFFKLVAVILIFLSITSHLMNSFWHKIMWDRQLNLWWQVYFRAPKIEDGSALILDFPKLSEKNTFNKVTNKLQWQRFYWAEEQIWSAGNLFLNYNNPPQNHFYGDFLKDRGILEKINKDEFEAMNNRNITYTRNFAKSIIINAPTDVSCLKVLAGENLIKPGVISPPPVQIFGHEPKPSWCFFFQKASLAKQLNDLEQLSKIKQEVIKKNLKPQDPSEWLVFE